MNFTVNYIRICGERTHAKIIMCCMKGKKETDRYSRYSALSLYLLLYEEERKIKRKKEKKRNVKLKIVYGGCIVYRCYCCHLRCVVIVFIVANIWRTNGLVIGKSRQSSHCLHSIVSPLRCWIEWLKLLYQIDKFCSLLPVQLKCMYCSS